MRRERPLRAHAEVALGRQRSPRHENGPHLVPYLRAANVKDGALDLSDVKEMNFTPSEQKVYRLKHGDVLVTEGSGSLSAVGASVVWSGEIQGVVCFQNTLLRMRPRSQMTDPRFLAWWSQFAFDDGLYASLAAGANIYHLSAERVRSVPVSFPDVAQQRAITDFLDAETARIDALIAKKHQLALALHARFEQQLDSVVWSNTPSTVSLHRLTPSDRQIMYGIVLPGPDVEGGVPIIKGGNVASGRLTRDSLASTTPEIESRYVRSRIRKGDILFAIRGGIGDVAIAPCSADGANITQDVARVSPSPGTDGRWLSFVLRSPTAQGDVRSRVVGATISGINIWDLKRVRIPAIGVNEQRTQSRYLAEQELELNTLTSQLARQLKLLAERRRALVTAAVTGQMEVPGVGAA